jgi:hypothetical protein
MKFGLGLAVTAAALGLSSTILAAPFDVDSTGTAETWEIKSSIEDGQERKLAVAAPLRENLELEIGTKNRNETVELKWRFLPAFAVAPEYSIDKRELAIPLIAQQSFGRFTLNAQVGYERELRTGERAFPLGILVRMNLAENLQIGAEVAGEAHKLGTNLGFKWEAARACEIQGLVGRTHDDGARVKLGIEMYL